MTHEEAAMMLDCMEVYATAATATTIRRSSSTRVPAKASGTNILPDPLCPISLTFATATTTSGP